ncbi:uncharacterized protein [Triticum aestivum]|uniref:uncharacterized protein isoform X1 n=1 Tax=Triticum aestivum TaxID=4565 RepID=UPI001D02B9BA|nr:uncharacterized protein LOC123107780 isoform X1 [Triticum aestivum]
MRTWAPNPHRAGNPASGGDSASHPPKSLQLLPPATQELAAMNPKELFGLFVGKERGEAIQDLEISLRAKVSLLFSLCCCHYNWTGAGLVVSCFPLQGSLTQAEDATLRKFSTAADVAYAASSTFFTLPLCFSINKGASTSIPSIIMRCELPFNLVRDDRYSYL